MPPVSQNTSSLIEQLKHKSSQKRRSAAKMLRKLKTNEAGLALLEALELEIKDKRTWETQYQMIMALGEVGFVQSLDFLVDLFGHQFDATIIYLGIGDAFTRLQLIKTGNVDYPIKLVEASKNPMLICGILRAIAMLELKLSNASVKKIIAYGIKLDIENESRVWIAAAAAGWPENLTQTFLKSCMKAKNGQIVRAVDAAQKKKYLQWSPL